MATTTIRQPVPPVDGPLSVTGRASHPSPRLLGRRAECEALDRLVASVRAGQSGVLVVSGEAGVGKTSLLEYLAGRTSGCRVARVAGIESEMELPFAGLHQVCAPMLDLIDHLPGPQRDALAMAFGLVPGDMTDRFFVGLAVLSLLSEAADERPLVCLVDDAQWLDHCSVQALAFVARRLEAESVALVLSTRPAGDGRWLAGLPELPIGGLSDADATALLGAALPGPVDAAVRDRIVAETRGNPLALLELPRGLTPVELAGGFATPDALPLQGRLEERFRRRFRALPDDTQRVLVVAAAEPTGDPTLLWRAAGQLGIGFDAAGPAVADDLLEIGTRVRFRHPLVRSAVYRAAPSDHRRSAHLALARAIDPERDPDRRAWHRAQATAGPDDEVAAELERSADRGQARGGLAAAAAFLERAAELSVDPARRAARLLIAAQVKHQAGAPEAALALLTTAQAGPLDELQRARSNLLRGQIAFASTRNRDAAALLLDAARQLEPLDRDLARDTYLDALSAALFGGRLGGAVGVSEVAEAARAGPPSAARPPDLLLDGLALAITEGYAAGAPLLKRAVTAFRAADMPVAQAIRWLWLATHAARDLWDDESWDVLCTRHVRLARHVGALKALPLALSARMWLHLDAGELSHAASLVEEIAAVTEATGSPVPTYGPLVLACFGGREAEASKLTRATLEALIPRDEGMGLAAVHHARAVLYNSLSRYGGALAAAEEGAADQQELGYASWSLAELVEAAVRSGEPRRASDALEHLAESTRSSGSNWALGIEARSRALLSEDDAADGLYREAIEYLSRTRVTLELARAHLLYGEWLRRAYRRVDARDHLRVAHRMFTEMRTEGFAERAARELAVTGETVRKRSPNMLYELTAQEAHIARLASDRLTNPEIGTELFLSPRTVEWHLRNVFMKLGVTSRKELRGALPST